VQREQGEGDQSAQQAVGIEQGQQVARVNVSRVQRHTADDVGERHPHRSAGSTEPKKITRSQFRRQRSLSTLPRNSRDTPRTISATRMIMQHPVGYRISPVTHRAQPPSIVALLTNSTVLAAWPHVIFAASRPSIASGAPNTSPMNLE
jgi:hypothetical protein